MDKNNEHKTDNLVLENVFYNKPVFIYIFKKISRISSATYIVTDLVKDTEPLKWSLRKSANDSMSFVTSFKDTMMSSKELLSQLTLLRYFLDLGKNARILSEMNVMIISREIDEIILLLNKEVSSENFFPEDFFRVPHSENETASNHLLNRKNDRSNYTSSTVYKGHTNVLYNNFNKISPTSNHSKNSHNDRVEIKGHRREEILKIIKNKGNLTIKDISSVIKDCSEKTIQRELISLLSEGVIKKTGERRWSRYSVI